MRYQPLLAIALSAASVEAQGATGQLGDAIPVEDNPVGVTFVANLPEKPWSPIDVEGNVKGSVTASSGVDGKGVDFKVQFSNLPSEGGPFLYHLHVAPVPEDGNCTQTLSHLDPFIRGENPPCDPETPEACEVGDLSGKHGKATSDPFELTFNDPYATLKDGLGAFFGNRSLVVHFANKTRITCANFELVLDDDCDEEEDDGGYPEEPSVPSVPTPTGGSNGTIPPVEPPTETGGQGGGNDIPQGAAAVTGISLLGAFAAVFFAL